MSVSLINGHIDDDEMTDEQIIKAFECCEANEGNRPNCKECPYFYAEEKPHDCYKIARKDALDLIYRYKAENERLQSLLDGWKTEAYKVADEKDKLYCEAIERVKTTKAEAVKEFALRLKGLSFQTYKGYFAYEITADNLNNLVKEMVGEASG